MPKKGTQKSTQLRKNSVVLHEKLKIVLPLVILKKKEMGIDMMTHEFETEFERGNMYAYT